MSKSKRELPPPGEMRDVDVQFVSLVTKAANKKRFTLFKSADYEEDETASEEEAKQAVGFLQHVKKFFMGGDEEHQEIAKADATAVAEPATFGAVIAQEEARSQMWRIFDAISTVFWNIFRSQSSNKRKLLETSLDEFKAKVLENFDKLTQVKVAKGEEGEEFDIEKAGAKISATRLKSLKEAHAYLTKVITEAEGEPAAAATGTEAAVTKQDEEEIDMKKEELQAIMKSAVEEAVKPLQERLDKIEKGDEGEGDPQAAAAGADDNQELTAASVAEIVKSAVGEATKDLGERLTRVEKARGLSNQPDDEGDGQQQRQVQKSADSEWGGLFSI